MTQQDLFIGGWYLSTKWNIPVKLTAEDIHEMVARAEGASIDDYIEEIVKPLPLTAVRIESFEFKYDSADVHWRHDEELRYLCGNEMIGYCFYDPDTGRDITRTFKNTHELQMAHFSLTGKRLQKS